MARRKKPHSQKRKPVDHNHPCIAAAIRVLQDAGGGPLAAVVIFRRAYDRGLLASTAYNTLRARLSQHQKVDRPTIVHTRLGYVIAPGGVPDGLPAAECAPHRPPLPPALEEDPLAIVPTPRPKRRRSRYTRLRNFEVTPQWLWEQGASKDIMVVFRLARWRCRSEDRQYPNVRELLMGEPLPVEAVEWLLNHLPFEPRLLRRLKRATGYAQRHRILEQEEGRAAS